MSPREVQPTHRHGDVLTAISDGIVGLMKEYYGRGPTRTKTYYEDDLVVCLMRGASRASSIMSELFILAPTDLVDDYEIPVRSGRRPPRD
ncbi:MAG TPA: Na-translocating system protein MpsC family protein [Solirubrobacteraceae bacterium]|nr:Na-translocating system protein MpsC family protein [Solirubrobacteraceae bacterium]